MEKTANLSAASQHWNWHSVAIENIGEGIERQMIVGSQLMVCRLRFAPHVDTPAHDHPHEQITFVERGSVRFVIGDEERIARAGDVLHFPSGCWHGATMLDEEVVLIDIFTPVREDFLVTAL
jgi:quercetin dioxygenase-like cupin family protein